jgi:outer membrane protein OmpA-like peptidoglycan-associated protein
MPEETPAKKPRISRKALIIGAVFAVVLVGSNLGVFAWQHGQAVNAQKNLESTSKKLDKANDSTESLKKQTADSAKAYKDLQVEYREVKDELATYKKPRSSVVTQYGQEDLDLTVKNAFTYHIPNYDQHIICINLTLKNTSTSDIEFKFDEYKLKDSSNQIFDYYQPPGGCGSDAPGLQSQTIKAGSTVSGSIRLTISDVNVSDYMLTIGDKSYKVTAPKTDKDWETL